MYSMIGGATSTIGARGERRINHHREKSFMQKLGRPSRLLRKQKTVSDTDSHMSHITVNSPNHLHSPDKQHSRTPSKTGSLEDGQWGSEETRYGDECCGGRVSLLHFCVTVLMAGVVILIVGAVQFKLEAELYHFRHIIVTAGCAVLGLGFTLFFIKCTCFCRPQHHKAGTEEAEEEDKSKLQNGTKKEPVTMSPVFHHVEDEEDANHHEMVLIESGQKSFPMKEISSKAEQEDGDQIIRAEVEICYS